MKFFCREMLKEYYYKNLQFRNSLASFCKHDDESSHFINTQILLHNLPAISFSGKILYLQLFNKVVSQSHIRLLNHIVH